jgi:hypothetical protein
MLRPIRRCGQACRRKARRAQRERLSWLSGLLANPSAIRNAAQCRPLRLRPARSRCGSMLFSCHRHTQMTRQRQSSVEVRSMCHRRTLELSLIRPRQLETPPWQSHPASKLSCAAHPNQREIISNRKGAQAITPAIMATNVRNAWLSLRLGCKLSLRMSCLLA